MVCGVPLGAAPDDNGGGGGPVCVLRGPVHPLLSWTEGGLEKMPGGRVHERKERTDKLSSLPKGPADGVASSDSDLLNSVASYAPEQGPT
jgi:hypothetical protein